MTAQAGSGPERHRDLTRPDLPLPRSGSGHAPAAAAPARLAPPVPPAPTPPQVSAPRGQNWHRMHYPIGVFLVAYGLTGFGAGLLGWDDRREEIAGYVGAGLATPALAAVKAIELLLVALSVAGLARRRDVWFLPALAGWLAGFGVFSLLDILKGKWGGLLEHLVFLAVFALVLFLSYGLSVKARVGRAARPAPPADAGAPAPAAPGAPGVPAPGVLAPARGPSGNLSRTQEFALATLNRLQQRVTPAFGAPRPQPQPPMPQSQPPVQQQQQQQQQGPPPQLQVPQPQAPAPAPPPETALPQSPQTVVDGFPQPSEQDSGKTVRAPQPERPAPPDATRPLSLPDNSDQ